jgi:hypothetical protein
MIRTGRERIPALIEKYGFASISIPPEPGRPGYCYTVGLADKGPGCELMVIGMDPLPASRLLQGAVTAAGDNEIGEGEAVINGLRVVLLDLPHRRDEIALLAAERVSKPFRLLQIVLPDGRGCFPWSPACIGVHREEQLVFLGDCGGLH